VLASGVAGPVGEVERDAAAARRLIDELDDASELPGQSPW